MITYQFEAKNQEGQIVTGSLVAKDKSAAEKILMQNQLEKISINPQRRFVEARSFLQQVPLKEKTIFARQLATMLKSGFPILQSLSVIMLQTRNQIMKNAVATMIADLEEGHNFSSALAKHPTVFSEVFVSVVKSGEASGKLSEVLEKLADNLEEEYDFTGKVRSALIYPIFLICAMLIIGLIMMIKVVPQLESVFTESGAQLPITTTIVIGLSHFLVSYWWIVLVVILIIIGVLYYYFRTPIGRLQLDYYKIKMPVFGDINTNVIMARFTNILGLLVKSGIPILESLKITSEAIGNRLYEQALTNIKKEVERGITLSVPMSKNPYFPPMVSQMVGVGEKTGNLDEVLESLSKFYLAESSRKIKNLLSLIEPILILIIGVGVGILVFSIIVPIYNLAQVI